MLSERAGVIAMGETRIEILVSDHIVVLFSACLPAFQPNLGKALQTIFIVNFDAKMANYLIDVACLPSKIAGGHTKSAGN